MICIPRPLAPTLPSPPRPPMLASDVAKIICCARFEGAFNVQHKKQMVKDAFHANIIQCASHA